MPNPHRGWAKPDENQPEITAQLRELIDLGMPLSYHLTWRVGEGFPDIVIGYDNKNYIFEIKPPGKKQNDNEVEFEKKWRGQYAVVESVTDILIAIGAA